MRVYNVFLTILAVAVLLSWTSPVPAETEKVPPSGESSDLQEEDRGLSPDEEAEGEEQVVRFTNDDLPGLWPMDRRAEPEGDVEGAIDRSFSLVALRAPKGSGYESAHCAGYSEVKETVVGNEGRNENPKAVNAIPEGTDKEGHHEKSDARREDEVDRPSKRSAE